jgi:hypothetical protein
MRNRTKAKKGNDERLGEGAEINVWGIVIKEVRLLEGSLSSF